MSKLQNSIIFTKMLKLRVTFSFCIALLSFITSISAQDVHYSQQTIGNKQTNPAFAANYDGNWQTATVYRQQWRSIGVPFTSSTLFFTKKFFTSIPALKLHGGVTISSDKSGDAILTGTLFNLNLGAEYQYFDNLFTASIQNGYVLKSFNQNGLTFPDQYDRNFGGFNENLASGENFVSNQVGYYDLGVGLLWKTTLNNDWKSTLGFSLSHITKPKESFFDSENRKSRGYGVQLLTEKSINEKISVLPFASYYRVTKAREMLIGSALKFNQINLGLVNTLAPFIYFRSGVSRNSDALIVGSRAELGKFDLGLSYDINISDLELASNYKGGFEISLIYTAPNQKTTQRRIPCERY